MVLQRYFNAYVLFPALETKAKRKIAPKLNELRQFDRLSLSEQQHIQRREAHRILAYARENVPYYRDLFREISFDESKVLDDIRYIEKLPVLTKAIVREQTERLKLPAAMNARKTGGSTGQSIFFYYDNEGMDWTSAINLRAYEMVGNHPHKKDAHISSEIGVGPVTRKDKFLDWLKLFSQNRHRVFVRSFSDQDLAASFAQLNQIRPYMLQGHPSSAYALATYVRDHKLEGPSYCHVFEPSGEMVTPKIAETVERYLKCKVTNRYGNAEFGVMAHSLQDDPYTRLKVFDRAFYMEPATNSSLIVSGLTNFSFPLFRYETGDIGTVRTEPTGTFIYDLQGRIHDQVEIEGESYATHYIQDYLDHNIRGIREFQILIEDSKSPKLRINAEHSDDESRIRSALQKRWPSGLEIEFVKFEDMIRSGWQNKFRHIVDMRGRQ